MNRILRILGQDHLYPHRHSVQGVVSQYYHPHPAILPTDTVLLLRRETLLRPGMVAALRRLIESISVKRF